jgi:hypothetical protein
MSILSVLGIIIGCILAICLAAVVYIAIMILIGFMMGIRGAKKIARFGFRKMWKA